MPLDALAGRTFGPYAAEVAAAKVGELVAATGDDPARWTEFAPPSYAATVLFAAAPAFFADPGVAPHTGSLIHSDQRYAWHAPIPIGAELSVTGSVASVRARRALNFVDFRVNVASADVDLVTLGSVFVISEGVAAPDLPEEAEPEWDARGPTTRPGPEPVPGVGEPLSPLAKSASRSDLVRYAGATGDFNPIHWDHDAARSAGLPGVIAHGLLIGAWMTQAAGRLSPDRPDPLADAQVRFRRALRPAVAAVVGGEVTGRQDGATGVKLAVTAGEDLLASGSASVRA